MESSGYKFYSFGVVVKAKERGSDYIEVYPVEQLPMESGKLSGDSRRMDVKLPDARGVAKSTKLEGGSVIKAKWTSLGNSARVTSPDVQANETVMVMSYADTQDFYWDTMGREPSLRRLECVRYMFSNKPEGMAPYDENSAYWVEYNTIDKRIKIHTSDNDGEAAAYDIEIDTKSGIVSFKDNLDNDITVDSVNGKFTGNIREDIELNTKRFKLNASESSEIITPSSLIKADMHVENAHSVVTNGLAVKQGDKGQACSFEGGIDIEGDISSTGNIDAQGTIIDGGGNTPNHTH